MRSDTRVRFTKDITVEAHGSHPKLRYAKAGDTGALEARLPGKVYLVRTGDDPTLFAVANDEIEILPTGEPTYHETETSID